MSDGDFWLWVLMVICILCAYGLVMSGKAGWGFVFLFVAMQIGKE